MRGECADWPDEETEAATAGAAGEANAHLWEESWDDDDDASEEFSKQLKCVVNQSSRLDPTDKTKGGIREGEGREVTLCVVWSRRYETTFWDP